MVRPKKKPPDDQAFWLKQCPACGTNNPSQPRHMPANCSGCGTALKPMPVDVSTVWSRGGDPSAVSHGRRKRY